MLYATNLFCLMICRNSLDDVKVIDWLNDSLEPTARVLQLPGIVSKAVTINGILLINPV